MPAVPTPRSSRRHPSPAPPTTAHSGRQRQILAALSPTTPLSVAALARLTGVSEVTIRRDLTDLARDGFVIRLHGGALRAPRRGASQPIALRRAEDIDIKRHLARATAALIEDGDSVIIDNGTTCQLVAEALAGREIRVLALSLGAAAALASVPGAQVTIPGGAVETDTLSMLTTSAVDAVRAFRADIGILGACAASSESGLTCTETYDATLKAAIIASSANRFMPATPRKLTRSSTYRFGEVADLDVLLTTDGLEADVLEGLRGCGVDLRLC